MLVASTEVTDLLVVGLRRGAGLRNWLYGSVAVIIGAMLVAPLLGPLSAMSIGLVTARTSLLRRGAITLTIGTLAAMALSLGVGWLLPLTEPTPQMLLRSEPSLLDVGIGVAYDDPGLAGGALLLFLVNIASVVATGAVAFWWLGMHPVEQDHATRRRITSAVLGAGLLFVVVTAVVRSERDLTDEELRAAQEELSESLDTRVDLRVVVQRVVSPD